MCVSRRASPQPKRMKNKDKMGLLHRFFGAAAFFPCRRKRCRDEKKRGQKPRCLDLMMLQTSGTSVPTFNCFLMFFLSEDWHTSLSGTLCHRTDGRLTVLPSCTDGIRQSWTLPIACQSVSSGRGDSMQMFSFETGWTNSTRWLSRLMLPSGLERGAPYFRSPFMGQSILDSWQRI